LERLLQPQQLRQTNCHPQHASGVLLLHTFVGLLRLMLRCLLLGTAAGRAAAAAAASAANLLGQQQTIKLML
jgi:hypothetical protein